MKVGILGGGQLARMLALAGVPMGLEFVIVDPKPDACAAGLGRFVQADYTDAGALDELAACDCVTCDFENVSADALEALADRVAVRPSAVALAAAQDRLFEKNRFAALGMDTAGYAEVNSRTDLGSAVERLGVPAVVKTRRMGYDGKGQMVLRDGEDLELAWRALGEHALIVEQWVEFDFECAITAVRTADGDMRCWPLSRTWHRDGILRLAGSLAVPGGLQAKAEALVRRLAEDLDYVGGLTLELFAHGDRLLANEFAPRVHNSAHWTIEGAVCSQFENHLRAVCGLPLGATEARGMAAMVNFIGRMPAPEAWLKLPGLHWHDYGKAAREGRKVGHATLNAADSAALKSLAPRLEGLLDADLLGELDSALGEG
ncbi:MAG: 5-(carboxyamino)imidazole ribonucleotide synthase [Wenzhouxiangellaceae bacterium]|nr:5-(carboxyamino)imidazole ribonucleotide synthase [Wenzhouxiangellaceae bacterium]MBS3747882.1 5-(carboxyamino)imidazole ribonucleotide synthase [Wenzhouxiangellaceae bacterium]MBS3824353.1 5-(carboxyamino)imidazole ribonucleotide synthase [Wenzhouxiangellaceae bacterium]